MPNFSTRITSGATMQTWTDAADADRPGRLNYDPARPHTFRHVALGATVQIRAIVDDVDGPSDAMLGGNLFTESFAEVPIWPAPAIIPQATHTSIVLFTPLHLGHHVLVQRRANGGAVWVPFVVV